MGQLQKEYTDLQAARNSTTFQGGAGVSYGGAANGGPVDDAAAQENGGAPVTFGGAVAPGVNPNDPNNNPAFQDRLTGEVVLDDWEYSVVFAVVLGPPPAPAPGTAVPAAAAPAAPVAPVAPVAP